MNVSFQCGSCGRKYQVGPAMAGKKVRCRGCGTIVPVPGGPAPSAPPSNPPPADRPSRATPSSPPPTADGPAAPPWSTDPSPPRPKPSLRAFDEGEAAPARPRPPIRSSGDEPPAPPRRPEPSAPPRPRPAPPKPKPSQVILDIDEDDLEDEDEVLPATSWDDLADSNEPPPLPRSVSGGRKPKAKGGAGAVLAGLDQRQVIRIGGLTAAVVVPLTIVAIIASSFGGGGDEAEASADLGRHRAVTERGVAAIEDLAGVLGRVVDVDSARRLQPEATEAARRLAVLSREAESLPILRTEEADPLVGEWDGRRAAALQHLRSEVGRVAQIPGAAAALLPAVDAAGAP